MQSSVRQRRDEYVIDGANDVKNKKNFIKPQYNNSINIQHFGRLPENTNVHHAGHLNKNTQRKRDNLRTLNYNERKDSEIAFLTI